MKLSTRVWLFGTMVLLVLFGLAPLVNASGTGIQLEKKTYLKSTDAAGAVKFEQKSEFHPGDTVIVNIKFASGLQLENLELVDTLPKYLKILVAKQVDSVSDCQAPPKSNVLWKNFLTSDTDQLSTVRWEESAIGKSTGTDMYFCYKYVIDTDEANSKNINFATPAIMYQSQSIRQAIAKTSNFLMTIGFPWINSAVVPPGQDTRADIAEIKDKFYALPATMTNSNREVLSQADSGLYVRFSGGKQNESRGGLLLNLPVRVTDKTGQNVLGTDNFFLLYNPVFYLFGNLYSGTNSAGSAFDFNSRNNTAAQQAYDGTLPPNSDFAVYGYNIDSGSINYWDRNNVDKNQAMQKNIKDLLGNNPGDASAPIVCEDDGKMRSALKNGTIYLNNKNCKPTQNDVTGTWPNGRVWYIYAGSDIDIGARFMTSGTIIIDFSSAPAAITPRAIIHTKTGSFSNNAALGLILINGGNVEFANDADGYSGMVFVPGKTDSQASDNGKIVFAEDGQPIVVRGSLVADKIDFNKRDKSIITGYSITVKNDAKIIYSTLPGFENLFDIIF